MDVTKSKIRFENEHLFEHVLILTFGGCVGLADYTIFKDQRFGWKGKAARTDIEIELGRTYSIYQLTYICASKT
jgi:hypothetical protein